MHCSHPDCDGYADGYSTSTGYAYCEAHRPAGPWADYPPELRGKHRQLEIDPRKPDEDLPLPSAPTDTGMAAAIEAREAMRGLRRDVYRAIEARGKHGATCEEIERFLKRKHQSVSSAVNALRFTLDLIEDSGRRRKAESGRLATVYVARENV